MNLFNSVNGDESGDAKMMESLCYLASDIESLARKAEKDLSVLRAVSL